MKFLATLVLFFSIGGCIIVVVVANKDKKTLIKDYNKQFQDTPLYYKRYISTSVVYKNNHKH
jgi:hypothetical protein